MRKAPIIQWALHLRGNPPHYRGRRVKRGHTSSWEHSHFVGSLGFSRKSTRLKHALTWWARWDSNPQPRDYKPARTRPRSSDFRSLSGCSDGVCETASDSTGYSWTPLSGAKCGKAFRQRTHCDRTCPKSLKDALIDPPSGQFTLKSTIEASHRIIDCSRSAAERSQLLRLSLAGTRSCNQYLRYYGMMQWFKILIY
jgi:hypothetical protein